MRVGCKRCTSRRSMIKSNAVSESPGRLVKTYARPHPESFWFSGSGLGPKNLLFFFFFWSHFQEMLMLLVLELHFEKHWYVEKNIRSRNQETLALVLALFSTKHEDLDKSPGLSFLICERRVTTAALSDLLLLWEWDLKIYGKTTPLERPEHYNSRGEKMF